MSDSSTEQMEKRDEQVEAAMEAAGQASSTPVQDDYFAFDKTERIMLPDGASWVDIKILNEGDRRKYLNQVNREVRLKKQSGDAIMKLATGDERYELLLSSIKFWNLKRNGQDIPCDERNVTDFLRRANPKVVDLIEKQVRDLNPWLTDDITVEDIDQQIEELQELRLKKIEDGEGKAS